MFKHVEKIIGPYKKPQAAFHSYPNFVISKNIPCNISMIEIQNTRF